MKRPVKVTIIIIIILLIVIAVAFHLFGQGAKNHFRQAVPSVVVTKTTFKSAPFFVKAQGTIEASKSVAVQAQATGVITKIGFTPGQTVIKGQLLFQLDPTTYQADLAKAEANLAKDQAQLKMIQLDMERYTKLIKKSFVSKQQYEEIKAQLAQQLSTVKADEAAIKQAKAALDYTQITAPIDGKTGNVTVKEGDLVTAQSNQVLVTINQLHPIYVDFYLSQNYLSLLMSSQAKQPLTVEVYSDDSSHLLDRGELIFIDNTVNESSGTILLKGSVPNKNQLLWPGANVDVKLIFAADKNVLAIPSQAVQTEEQGQFVYVIKDNRAYITPVKISRQIGQWSFVEEGLTEGATVATIFPPDLKDKSPVNVVTSSQQGQ